MFFSRRNILKILFVFLIIFSSNIYSQPSTKVYKILGLSVEGNKTADANTIIAYSGLKIGDELQIPGDKTLNAIRQLRNLNIFSDVQIIQDKLVADGIFLIIKVEEYPRIEKTVFEGNDDIDTEEIEKEIHFGRGQVLRPDEVNNLEQRIIKLYEKDGYLNTKVKSEYFIYFKSDTTSDGITVTWRNEKDFSDEYKTDYEEGEYGYSDLISRIKDRILLKVIVDEGDEVTVRKIEFTGNQALPDDDLKDAMDEISEARWWKFWDGASFEEEEFEKDKKNIVDYYRKNGYRDAEILSDSLIYSNNNEDLTILIKVYEGPQYKIRNITWEGNTVFADPMLDQRLGLKKGDIFDYDKFEKNLRGNENQSDVTALYMDNGYLTFNLTEIEQKVGEDSIDIHIRLDERNQFKIGMVGIKGNDKTKDKVIRRELYTIPGDYFNRALLIRSIQQLANLQYFNVEKLYAPNAVDYKLVNDSTVNLSYTVEEKSSDYLNASVGYSGAFGFSGALGVTLTNFSIAEPFSLGGGQVLSFNWQFGVGNLYRTFSIGFTEPWLFDTPTLLGFEVFDTRQQYYYDLRQTGGTIRLGRRLKWPDDFFNVQGFFRYQYNNVIDGQDFYAEGRSHQYTIGGTISRRNIDNPIFPSQGSSVAFNVELSGAPLLPGDLDYYKLGFKAEWYNRLFNSSKVTFYTVANIGYLQELNEETKSRINPFDKFFMGGNGLIIATEPLRGYDDRTVGPHDINGNALGGRLMERFTTELRFAVTLEPIPLYLLAFAEAGNVFPSFKEANFFDLRRSVGVGARVLINPIGLIGFDLGYGFDRKIVDGKDPSWLFHFQFGKGL